MGYLIRKAVSEDFPVLESLAGAIYNEFGAERDLSTINEKSDVWVLEVNGALSGLLCASPDNNGGCELKHFLVAATWRGCGMGKQMLEEAKSFYKAKNLKPFWHAFPQLCCAFLPALAVLGFTRNMPPEYLGLPEDVIYLEISYK